MLELLFVIGFFVMLMVTGISLLGILAAIVVATVVMFIGGLFALTLKLLPWLLLAVAVVWVIRAIKSPKVPTMTAAKEFIELYPTYSRTKKRKGFPREAQFLFRA
ncbi:MAG: phage shock protein [Enterobacter mori]|nr:phage shock protein [Enterobacter mori]